MSFRDNLQHLRATRNMTQEQLAMLLGVSRQSVTKWEAEKSYPEMDKLIKICRIFECSLDDLVTGDLTCRPAEPATGCDVMSEPIAAVGRSVATEPAAAAEPAAAPESTTVTASSAPSTDVCGYDAHMRRFAWRIAWGVAVIIAGVAGSVLTSWLLGGSVPGGSDAADAASLIPLFAGVVAGLALLIPAGMGHAAFVREHPYVADFYTLDEKRAARSRLSLGVVGGLACILGGVVVVSLVDGLMPRAFEDASTAVLLVLVATGVWCFIYFGMMANRVDVAGYNKDALEDLEDSDILTAADLTDEEREELLARKRGPQGRKQKLTGTMCGVIMLVATIVALVWLFCGSAGVDWDAFDWSHSSAGDRLAALFWLPWPIGGLCCGVVSLVIEGFYRET